MNATDSYLVNCAPADHPDWQPARWERPGDIPRFHWMWIGATRQLVLLHDSCIKRIKTDTKPLEDEMRRLLELPGLVPEARKLITAALQAQASGKTDFAI